MKLHCFLSLLLFLIPACADAQIADSLPAIGDSVKLAAVSDTLKAADSAKTSSGKGNQAFILKNKLLNEDGTAISYTIQRRRPKHTDLLFYVIAFMVSLLAFLRFFYSRYFTNLFRVFFNTSLRQNQITDQLLQAKLPSFLFNIFFVVSAGIYLFVLFSNYKLFETDNKWLFALLLILLMGLIYFIKFCTLKFTGWITGLDAEVNVYVFMIFLINKTIGVFLVPFIIVLAFSGPVIAGIAASVSLMAIGLFLLLRFFRSYALIQNKLKVSRFHFFLYLAGLEIVPLLLIYKGLMIYLSKNL